MEKINPYFHWIFIIGWIVFLFKGLLLNITTNLLDWNDPPYLAWQIYMLRDKILSFNWIDFYTLNTHYPYKLSVFFSDSLIGQSIMAIPFFFIKNPFTSQQPIIICIYQSHGKNYLMTAELSPITIELIARNGKDAKNRSIVIAFIGSIVFSFVVYSIFRRNIKSQFDKVSKYINDELSEAPETWDEFEPIISEFQRLRREQQELKFGFEREAAVMSAKSESRSRSLSLLRDIAYLGNTINDEQIMMRQILAKLNKFFNTFSAVAFVARPDGQVKIIMTDNTPPELCNEFTRVIAPDASQLIRRRVDQTGFVLLDEVQYATADTALAEIAQKHGIIGYIRIPLSQRGEYLGAIHLYSIRVFPNEETFEKLLKGIGEEVSVALENRRLYADLELQLKESLALYEISKFLISAIDYDILLEQILWVVQESFGFAATSILLLDPDKNELYVKASWGYQSNVEAMRIAVGKGITGWVASSGQPLIVPNVNHDPRYIPTDLDIRSEMAVPLVVGGKIIGVLDIGSREVNRFSERDLWFLSSLAAQASLAIDRAKLYQQVKEQAIKDSPTNTFNRRFCDVYVQHHAKEILLKGMPVSIILVDINDLKRINDTYGHSAGDKLLVEVADFLRQNFPDNPIARYGGDEFIVFLDNVSQIELDEIVENLRKLKTRWQLRMSQKHSFPIDFAIGSATANRPDELELLIDYADTLMYRDKQGI